MVWYGEEQPETVYLLDGQASNYIFGRQPMASSIAAQMHGCYTLGSAAAASSSR